jgi:hypothetical protein
LTIEICHGSSTTVWTTNNNTERNRFDIVHHYKEKIDFNRISINRMAKNDLASFGNDNITRELLRLTIKQKNDPMREENKSSAPTAGGPFKKKWNHHKKRHGNKSPLVQPAKFQGGKEELGGNYFDCMGYGQSDRFMKTVKKIANHIGQDTRAVA